MRVLFQLFFLMAVLPNASALVLGDIQVNSPIGQTLSAKIALIDLGVADAQQLDTQLASIVDYKKLGLQYPNGQRFLFRLVNEPGTQPYIRVSTSRPVDDPFVSLLIEVTSDSGKLLKAYNLLLDPSPVLPVANETQQAESSGSPEVEFAAALSDKPVKFVLKHRKHHRHAKTVRIGVPAKDGKSHMKLAMSLSISSYDASVPANENADALQEELIVKQKLVEDLDLQIDAMKSMISSLQNRQGAQPVSSVAAGEIPAASEVSTASAVSVASEVAAQGSEKEAPKPQVGVSIVPPVPEVSMKINWLNVLLVLVVFLLGVAIWYRKYRHAQEMQKGTFDDLHGEHVAFESTLKVPVHIHEEYIPPLPKPVVSEVSAPVAPAAPSQSQPESSDDSTLFDAQLADLTFGEQSMEIPAYTEEPSAPIVPPEYAILMEANKYLRTGNDKQAEDALIRAIQVNPNNAYGYLALLKIYGQRKDTVSFERLTLQLRDLADEASFAEAKELGRDLEPGNPLYAEEKPAEG